MSHPWTIVNSALIALAFPYGYVSLDPDKLQHKNPDLVLCITILIITPVFALLAINYSVNRWKLNPIGRPSWNRNPLNWWGDPLQSLFISTCIAVAMAIGGTVRKPSYGSVGFWMLAVYASLAIGLVVGQALVYWIYRQRIAAS